MEFYLLPSGKPSSNALPSGRSSLNDQLGKEVFVTRNLLHGCAATNTQGNHGEKSKVSKDKTTAGGVESESQHGLKEISLKLEFGSTTCITKKSKASENPEGNDGEKSKISMDKTTAIETRSEHGSEEISLNLELSCGICTTKKRKSSENSLSEDEMVRFNTVLAWAQKHESIMTTARLNSCLYTNRDGADGSLNRPAQAAVDLSPPTANTRDATPQKPVLDKGKKKVDESRVKKAMQLVDKPQEPEAPHLKKTRLEKGKGPAVEAEKGKSLFASSSAANLPPSTKKERHIDASLELKFELGPKVMKKTIETSDIGGSCRLLLPKKWVQDHILGLWDAQRVANGIQVGVWDFDTKSEHELIFKYWPGGRGSYVLNRKWTKEFVKRRSLKKGDEIGLYWDPPNSRFIFSLLNPTRCS